MNNRNASLGEIMKLYLILLIIITLTNTWAEIFTDEDSILLDNALAKIELTPQDLMFLKDWSDECYLKNSIITNSINNPYFFLNYASQINNISDPYDFDKLAYKFLNNNDIELTYPNVELQILKKNIETNDLADLIANYIRIKTIHFEQMFTHLNEEEMAILKSFSSSIFSENASDEELDISPSELEDIVSRINWYIFYQPVIIENKTYLQENLTIISLYDFITNNIDKIMWQEENLFYDSEVGEIIIGSIYDDQYLLSNAIAIVEPAGNDNYNFLENNQNTFFLYDASGHDRYLSENSLFSANFGFSFAYDLMGDDYYSAHTDACSAKFAFQEFIDFDGNDVYTCDNFAFAAAAFAASLFIDKAGNDIYSTGQYGQGFASTWGFSLLLDETGTDTYICGTSEFHAPLAPEDYRSMGQGMGFGMRPNFGGGIGILHDRAGNDRYLGGVYAQGVGYWYGLGLLIDNSGNDFYNAVYYPQGSGIHLAAGLLFDEAGEDSYYSKHGPGQGAGHDFALGIFIDGDGNDHYSIEGGNGLGLTNSVGIFIDKAGNDRYENATNSNYGYGKAARASGSIGVFLDLAGKDFYPHTNMKDSLEWKQGLLGLGIDLASETIEDTQISTLEQVPADIDSLAAIAEIFSYASEWEVGNVINRVRRAREILLDREDEALTYILANKINTRDTKEYRAIKEFFENSVSSQSSLIEPLTSQDSLAHKNAISLVASFKNKELVPIIVEFLNEGKYISTCVSALASFKEDQYLPLITKYIDSPNEKVRFALAGALKSIDTELANQEIVKMKNDSSFLVRTLVLEHLKKK